VNVYSALKRMRDTEVVKHRAEWGLAERYPNLVGKGRTKKKGTLEPEEEAEGGGAKSSAVTSRTMLYAATFGSVEGRSLLGRLGILQGITHGAPDQLPLDEPAHGREKLIWGEHLGQRRHIGG
jgi:hypothetical protein